MNREKWQAIIQNDSSFDGSFYYGVSTTRIFCRPSCRSRNPKKEHVRIFNHPNQAIMEGFRPCKRCKPDGLRLPDENWVVQITEVIDKHFREPLTLELIAEQVHSSPFHMHRTFKRIKGYTPVEYVMRRRIDTAKQLLSETDLTVKEAALHSGFMNAAHFSTIFLKRTGCSPREYRNETGGSPTNEKNKKL